MDAPSRKLLPHPTPLCPALLCPVPHLQGALLQLCWLHEVGAHALRPLPLLLGVAQVQGPLVGKVWVGRGAGRAARRVLRSMRQGREAVGAQHGGGGEVGGGLVIRREVGARGCQHTPSPLQPVLIHPAARSACRYGPRCSRNSRSAAISRRAGVGA
jgi:hypothetical protein